MEAETYKSQVLDLIRRMLPLMSAGTNTIQIRMECGIVHEIQFDPLDLEAKTFSRLLTPADRKLLEALHIKKT